MICIDKNKFLLSTKNTSYAFRVMETGQLEHLHYGGPIGIEDLDSLTEKRVFQAGTTIGYDKEHPELNLEDIKLEMSSYGKGDIREPFVEIVYPNGSYTSDFVFEGYEMPSGAPEWEGLPVSYSEEDQAEYLIIRLREKTHDVKLELHYTVYEYTDVICRKTKLINNESEPLRLLRLMSNQVDFPDAGYTVTNFCGSWVREMKRRETTVNCGMLVLGSYTGTSSNRSNPFVMLSKPSTTESSGSCYGFNIVYSGNHFEGVQVNAFGKTRFLQGINPRSFEFRIDPGESFRTPEAVMTYSSKGYTGMSHNMHTFVRNNVVRGYWKKRERPILINSWEASYFDISESKLLNLAKAAKSVGIELFVMDDGWFGKRDNDTSSLGDWTVNRKKLPGGLEQLSGKIHALGLMFGIWVEPEMVNVDSDLYRAHPEWVIQVTEGTHSEGRNQRILDLTNPEVVDYLDEAMSRVFTEASADYVKWDMNRIFSDAFSQYLPKDRQMEVFHRYVLGLYDLMGRLTAKFPKILFEGCASGGNRFDLGILSYFPQIWGSDNTDAVCRVHQQEGYSFGYPLSCVSAHVSACPNHQTLRETPLDTRFDVAAFGICGYELNLADMKKDELEKIKRQIDIYKKWRKTLQSGTFYRGRHGNLHEWITVSEDKTKAVGMILQELVHPNTLFEKFTAKGLDPETKYHFYNMEEKQNIRNFGDLINTQAPVHVKQDSMVHYLISKFVTMPGETEDAVISGQTLMSAGINLKQAFSGTGYSDQVRFFQDFSARMYFMEKTE